MFVDCNNDKKFSIVFSKLINSRFPVNSFSFIIFAVEVNDRHVEVNDVCPDLLLSGVPDEDIAPD